MSERERLGKLLRELDGFRDWEGTTDQWREAWCARADRILAAGYRRSAKIERLRAERDALRAAINRFLRIVESNDIDMDEETRAIIGLRRALATDTGERE